MAERCSCGALPPDDALFCHKCGRPLRELPSVVEEAPTPPPPLVAPPIDRSPINFRNRAAVRSGLLTAAVSCLLIVFVPVPVYVNIVWFVTVLVAAGFLSVWLYGRRTGEELSVRNGAWMGWITGLFCFAFAAAMTAVSILMISGEGKAAEQFREQLGAQGPPGANPDEVMQMLLSPAGIALIFLFLFVIFTLLPTAGGAVGAKVLEKE